MELGTFKRDFKMLVSKFSGNTQALLKNKSYLAGGAIRSLYLQEKPKDYDLFFLDTTACYEVIEAAREKGLILHSSSSAVTLKAEEGQVPFQLIRLDFGSPTDVIGRFDFTCNMNFYMPANDWGRIQYPDDIATKTLVFNPKASTPLSALIRANRFMHKGWDVSDLQFARIGVAISKLKPITSSEQMKNLGLSEYSGPNVQSLDIGQVLSDELHPRRTRDESSDPLGYQNFVSYANLDTNLTTSMAGAIARIQQDVQQVSERRDAVERSNTGRINRRGGSGRFVADANPFGGQVVDRHGEAMVAIPEPRPEVENEAHAQELSSSNSRWWDMTTNREVAAAPMTVERLRNAVERIQNMPMATPSEVDF